jgi:phospholipid/cholesterol/gamma-HCH transport system substrate-binding protein
VAALTGDARKAMAGIAPVLKTTEETVASFGKLSTELTRRLDGVDRAVASVDQVGRAAAAFEAQTLPRLNALAEDADRSARTLDRVADRLGEEPTAVLFGPQPGRPGPGEAGFVAPVSGAK